MIVSGTPGHLVKNLLLPFRVEHGVLQFRRPQGELHPFVKKAKDLTVDFVDETSDLFKIHGFTSLFSKGAVGEASGPPGRRPPRPR